MAEAHSSFGRYRVTGTLGAGAMGEVYAAVDEVLGREVAVKTLRGGVRGFGARLLDERFRQEARAIAALTHPGIVRVFDVDVTADPPYLVMERVAGPSLKERLEQGPLSVREARALGIQLANALGAAHAAGIVHRDVKPANILAAGGGMWKLADFGVAHVPDSSLTITGQFVGSPAYAPPEALVRGDAGPPGDLYGLGATLYEAVAGRWPRKEAPPGAVLIRVPPLRELAPDVPNDVAVAIDRAISLEAALRPDAAELAAMLAGGHLRDQAGPTMSLTGVAAISMIDTPVARKAPPWRVWAIAGGVVLLVIIIIAVGASGSSPAKPSPSAPAAAPPPKRPVPATIEAHPPPIAEEDEKAARDWYKMLEKLTRRDFGEALHKVRDFEKKYGESTETRELREQLEALPEDQD